ncbi:MAG: VOC family protein [Oscillospiraceae bacterium]|jgi:lactoylglutathione lyase|nr:VOC family protein [Oscillospiraceae bacterium]
MSESFGVKGLSHIGVIVSDIEASIVFYRDRLGFIVDQREELDRGTKLAFIHAGTCIIELIERPDRKTPEAPGPVDHICLDVSGIDELVGSLRAKGVTFMSDKVSALSGGLAGKRNIFLTGPDGEKLEFFEG